MKRIILITLSLILLSSCSREVRDRLSDNGANVSASFLQNLEIEFGRYDVKIDSILFVGTEGGLKLYDIYYIHKDQPVSVGGVVIHPTQVFHTKVDTTDYSVVAFKRNEQDWVGL